MRALKRQVATEVAGSTGTAEVVDLVPFLKAAIVREIGSEKKSYIAELVNVTDECARKWQRGITMPNPVHLALLAREFPAIYAAWIRCVEGRWE